jgi:hypothetical protein
MYSFPLEGNLILSQMQAWARQRTSIYAHDSLNGYLISAVLAFLTIDSGGCIINRSMTTRDIFRIFMNFLGTSKQMKVYFEKILTNVYYIEAYLYSCSKFKVMGQGFGDSADEEAYSHQRGLSTYCTKTIDVSYHKYTSVHTTHQFM